MEKVFCVEGNKKLKGEVDISGSKNSVLCLIAASLILNGETILENVPRIKDVFTMLSILEYLNCEIDFKGNTLRINPTSIVNKSLKIDEMIAFRASYYFYGALIKKFKTLNCFKPGGCHLGNRPIDQHLLALSKLGVTYYEDDGLILNYSMMPQQKIVFEKVSLGATVNAILLSVQMDKPVLIVNPSFEPEVLDLVNFLNTAGARISKKGDNLLVDPSKELKGTKYQVIPDRIEAGTFLLLGAALAEELKVNRINTSHMKPLFDVFDELGVEYTIDNDSVIIKKTIINKGIKVKTGPHPEFPSDLQPLLTSYLTTIPKISIIQENVYEDRFSHINQLRKMGANIVVVNNNIVINGIFKLKPAIVEGKDLRSTAALVFSALLAKGKSYIKGLDYLYRGYEDFEVKLNSIGGKIDVVEANDLLDN